MSPTATTCTPGPCAPSTSAGSVSDASDGPPTDPATRASPAMDATRVTTGRLRMSQGYGLDRA